VINGYIVHWLWVKPQYWARVERMIADMDRATAAFKARKAERVAA
jgi:hypothetical protein